MCTYTAVNMLQSITTRNCTDTNDKDAFYPSSSLGIAQEKKQNTTFLEGLLAFLG